MKKLWHIWVAFGLCLAIVLSGMVWLTLRAIDLDRAEVVARRQADLARRRADLQERVATALWRMDWTLTPLIAQEVSRPSFVYQSFLPGVAAGNKRATRRNATAPSPLLTRPSRFVRLYFEVLADNSWKSPQTPDGVDVPAAVAAGVSLQQISERRKRLSQLEDTLSYSQLLAQLPDALLPPINTPDSSRSASDVAIWNDFAAPLQQQQGIEQQSLPQQSSSARHAQSAPPPRQTRAPLPGSGGRGSGDQVAQARARQEWERRNSGVQSMARSQRAQLSSNSMFLPESATTREGVSRPVWLDDKLILARRVKYDGSVRIQGCWLDWPRIKEMLADEVADLFPEIDLLPVASDSQVPPGRLLATLPVQLSIPVDSFPASGDADTDRPRSSFLAIKVSLVLAWCCLLLGSIAIAVMLRGVLALSERRAAFVSAVTHELRSPLTTFRMYAEMLAEGMVRDDEQRNRYLATLRVEADRLSHLVENVLQYARLERGRGKRRRVEIDLKRLMQQTTERLPERARQAGMELHETMTPQDAQQTVLTDPAAIEQILFNLIDNSCKYASSADDRRIHVHWSVGHRVAQVRVTDHGPGIDQAHARRLFRPFSKSDQEAAQSAPGIGLGLALCRRLAAGVGGKLTYDSHRGDGAAFLLELPLVRRGRGRV